MPMFPMARCTGRDGSACEFSTHQIGAPAWVRAPAARCFWCVEPSRLHHLIASETAGDVWSTLARLMILDRDVFSAALLRIPEGERERARAQARRAACEFVAGRLAFGDYAGRVGASSGLECAPRVPGACRSERP